VALNPSIPLAALLATGGFLAAGFAADASALDQRLDGFVDARPTAHLDVDQATGQGDGETIQLLHLTVDTPTQVNLTRLAVEDGDQRASPVLDVHPIRDEDGSLANDVLDADDRARLVVDLATPMEEREQWTLTLDLAHGGEETLVVETPAALDDGYTRLDHVQR
jgi:hypothetical protein